MLLIALLTVFLAVLLVYKNRGVQPNSLWFSLTVVIISIIQLAHYFAFTGTSTTWTAVFFMHPSPLYYLLGPFIYFYTKGTLSDEMRHGWKESWHYLPSLIHLAGIIPYLIKPWAFKLHVAEQIMQDVHYMVVANDLVLYPVIVNMIMRPISWISYTGYSLYLVLRFQQQYPFEKRIPIKDAKRILRFMVIFLVICLLTELSYTALSIEYFLSFGKPTAEFINTPWIWAINLGIAAIPFSLILYPEILYGIPRVKENKTELNGVKNKAQLAPVKTGFITDPKPLVLGETLHKAEEAENNFQQLATRIIDVMDKEQPYLRSDFSPDDLANMLDVPKHHLYYCFNSILNTRFTRLRAEYRVRYAQNLIEKGETRQKTLEAIGLESGFSNRISFNNAFREVTGFSPTEFLRKHSGSGS